MTQLIEKGLASMECHLPISHCQKGFRQWTDYILIPYSCKNNANQNVRTPASYSWTRAKPLTELDIMQYGLHVDGSVSQSITVQKPKPFTVLTFTRF